VAQEAGHSVQTYFSPSLTPKKIQLYRETRLTLVYIHVEPPNMYTYMTYLSYKISTELVQPDFSEVFPDNNICDCVKHEANVPCVCGTCEVGVDLFLAFLSIEVFKSLTNVVLSVIVCVGTWMEREGNELACTPQ